MKNKLIFVLGPTASGKTSRAIELAQHYHTEIVSCDSRQFYQELNIGVARPSNEELAAAPHHFIACRSVTNPYNVFDYEQDALALINTLFQQHDTLIAVGGSGLYVEALRHGMAVLPDPPLALREELQHKLQHEGVASLRAMLQLLDPDYYAQVDLANGVRIQRALEVTLTAGVPYSQLVNQPPKDRPFDIVLEVIDRDRAELRSRIDQRVSYMMSSGLEDEAQSVYHLRHLQSLNTVGYKEFFTLWEQQGGTCHLTPTQSSQVAEAIKLSTWHYAKKQLTWLKKKANTSNE